MALNDFSELFHEAKKLTATTKDVCELPKDEKLLRQVLEASDKLYSCATYSGAQDTEVSIFFTLHFIIVLTTVKCLTQSAVGRKIKSEAVQEISNLIKTLDSVFDFVDRNYYKMNLDSALGIALSQAQLLHSYKYSADNNLNLVIQSLIRKSEVYRKIIEFLPKNSPKELLFTRFLLNPRLWMKDVLFSKAKLNNLGIYESWSDKDLLKSTTAIYQGVTSDECLVEIMHEDNHEKHSCSLDRKCELFMFGNRNDTSYVLTHRLLFVQIARMMKCDMNERVLNKVIENYCALALKEAKTNAHLNFPQHDIFLEQVVLCGMEGFAEFLKPEWVNSIINWQTTEGCYGRGNVLQSRTPNFQIRSANDIGFGCTDHATGLAAAALSLNLHYVLRKVKN